MSGAPAPSALEPLVEASRSDRTLPLLITGLAAAAVLSGGAEMEASRETRGGLVEWGGAYAQGIRLTGPWTASGEIDGQSFDLPGTLTRLSAYRWKVLSSHAWGSVRVEQEIVPMPLDPGVGRTFSITAEQPKRVRITQRLRPFLAPVAVEGVKPYEYRVVRRGTGLEIRAFGSVAVVTPSVPPTEWRIDGRPWAGEEMRGEVGSIEIVHDLEASPLPCSVTVLVWGGIAATVERGPDLGSTVAGGAATWARASDDLWSSWLSATPSMELPDAPQLTRAYDLARTALRALYTRPTSELTGLVAGYPWYPALWCRDLAWMLPAVLWLGDLPWAEASVRTALGFQATAHIPLLGAEIGEVPMQISPGPVFLYGTSDTSLYYPDLVRRLADHGSSAETLDAFWPHLRAIADWARGKTDPATGLVTNGGEVEEIRQATARVGSIHYGFDAVDTTIWDSTDRRDHAIDVQVHALRAFRALAELGPRLGRSDHAAEDAASSARLAEALATRYRWPAESYLYDALRRDGSPVPKIRPNALLAVGTGGIDPAVARSVVARALADDLSTPWGLRTLSDRDPAYDPIAYHDGQVWTIATAWAAGAAFAIDDREAGIRSLGTIAARLLAEHGLANECYRGDRAEAFDSCFLLGLSVAPFLTVLFEQLWGLSVRTDRCDLVVDPRFPTGWTAARLSHFSVAHGHVDLAWSPDALAVHWSGPGPLTVRFGSRTLSLSAAGNGSVPAGPP